ncbi:MAG TPA: hypothetical protein VG076_12615 [Acidimicrobiales bacterium]|jgi:hypothetical protein|nr:hypothetical protein [Acidimicrobiales bacterium]
MPDLSNLLGAVYGDGPSSTSRDPEDEAHVEKEPAADERAPAVPDWADDDHLDAAFAQWKPGPADDASPVEHAFVKDTDDDDPPPPLPDDLAAALSEALVATSGRAHDPDDDEPEVTFQPRKLVDFSAPVLDDDDEDVMLPESVWGAHTADEHAADEHEVVEQVTDQHTVEAHTVEAHTVEAHTVEAHIGEPAPPITPQRAAAAELTAASRIEPDPVFAPPAPAPQPAHVPEPVPVASAPASIEAVAPATMPVAAGAPAAPTTPLPPGARHWDRSEDDILPEKQSRKLFSFSLRRG